MKWMRVDFSLINKLGVTASAFACALVLLVTVNWAHSPTLNIAPIHHDQYRHFIETFGEKRVSCSDEPQHEWLIKIGRPVAALYECLIFKSVSTRSDLVFLRFWVVQSLGVLAILVMMSLLKAGFPTTPAALAGLFVATTPGAQNAAFMTNFANSLGPSFALVGAWCLLPAHQSEKPLHFFGWRLRLRHVFGVTCLMISLFTYPVLAFLFLLPFLVLAIEQSNLRSTLVAVRGLLIFGVCSVLYFATVKMLLYRFPADSQPPSSYSFSIASQGLIGKLNYLFESVFPRILSSPAIEVHLSLSTIAVVLIAASVLGGLISMKTLSDWRALFTFSVVRPSTAFVAILLIGSYFIVTPAFFLYRTIWPMTALISTTVIVLGWPLISRFGPNFGGIFFGTLVLLVGLLTSEQQSLNSLQSFLELNHMKASLASNVVQGEEGRQLKSRHVHIEAGDYSRRSMINRQPITDEYFVPTTAFSFGFVQMVRVAALELGVSNQWFVDGAHLVERRGRESGKIVSTETSCEITNEHGLSADCSIQDKQIKVASWGNIIGNLSTDSSKIVWIGNRGPVWTRSHSRNVSGFNGSWTIDHFNGKQVFVTISRPGEKKTLADDTILIDMTEAMN